jgi:hypothetical protein
LKKSRWYHLYHPERKLIMPKKISGGGIQSSKLVRVGVNAGPSNSRIIDPRGVSQLGYSPGSTIRKGGGYTAENSALPMLQGTMKQVPLGNQLATNVGKGSPGAGRQVYKSGYQSLHGQPVQGSTPQPKDILSAFGPDIPGRGRR